MTNFESCESSVKSPAPKEGSLSAALQDMYLLYNFDERSLFTSGDKETG